MKGRRLAGRLESDRRRSRNKDHPSSPSAAVHPRNDCRPSLEVECRGGGGGVGGCMCCRGYGPGSVCGLVVRRGSDALRRSCCDCVHGFGHIWYAWYPGFQPSWMLMTYQERHDEQVWLQKRKRFLEMCLVMPDFQPHTHTQRWLCSNTIKSCRTRTTCKCNGHQEAVNGRGLDAWAEFPLLLDPAGGQGHRASDRLESIPQPHEWGQRAC